VIGRDTQPEDVSRSDLKTLERGLRERWDFPEETFRAIPRLMAEIIGKRYPAGHSQAGEYVSSRREQISAARVLAVMHGQNIAADPPPQELRVSQTFEFDMSVASTMSREDMAAVTRALGITNGRHDGNGNGQHPAADA
jgi:hypothetical protein